MKRTRAFLMALICAFGFMFSACDVPGNSNESSSDSSVSGDVSSESSSSSSADEDSSSSVEDDSSDKDSSSTGDSSSSVDPDPVDSPQLYATPIDITNILNGENGSKLTKAIWAVRSPFASRSTTVTAAVGRWWTIRRIPYR